MQARERSCVSQERVGGSRPVPPERSDFRFFRQLPLRWHDNDIYAHVNNTVYYSLFDTLVNGWYCERGLLVPGRSDVIGLVVSTSCDYFAPIAFPEQVEGAIRVDHIGKSSIVFGLAIFKANATCAAAGRFTHVTVTSQTHRPVGIPDTWRAALATLASPSPSPGP